MIKLLSWVLVGCIALYFFGIMVMVFTSPSLIPIIVGVSIVLALISGILLLILLIRERIKDKEAEQDDLNKY
jgi:ABC-type antimicrobial peptide transport system permease subunit